MKVCKFLLSVYLPAVLLFAACTNNDYDNPQPTLQKSWTVSLNVANELSAPAGRTDSGTAILNLYSDYTLQFEITVKSLAAGDALTAAHIHAGDPVTNGGVYIPFPGSFTANVLSGSIALTQAQADSIQNFPMYVNVHSNQSPGGIMRGQMDKTLVFSVNVAMSGDNEAPPVVTTATGTAYLRLSEDNILYSKVVVNDLESNDALTAAHIHTAVAGINGDVLVALCGSAADFGITKTSTLTSETVTSLLTDAVYVNAHTTLHPAGIIRGQIR